MKIKSSLVKRKLKDGRICFGSMLRSLKSPIAVPLYASIGWDFIIVDTEHNDYNNDIIGNLCLLSKYEEIDLYVRVPDKEYHLIALMLDLGADGIVYPQVKTQAESQLIKDSSRYYPIGKRGVSISEYVTRCRNISQNDYTKSMNGELVNIVQIESQEGIENIDKILSVGEIDAVMIGPADLTQDMGIPGEFHNPRVKVAFKKIIESCDNHGVAPGIHLSNIEDVRVWINAGMRFIAYSYDLKFLKDSATESLSNLQKLIRH